MHMKKIDVVTIGSALRDVMFYSDQFIVMPNPKHEKDRNQLMCTEYGAKIRSNDVWFEFGGGAANTAVNFAGLGLKTAIVTSLGDDLDGQAIRQQCKEAGIDLSCIQTTKKHRTGFSFLAVDKKTGEHVAYVYYGAAQDLRVYQNVITTYTPQWFYIASLNTLYWKKSLEVIFNNAHQKARIAWNPGGTQLKSGFTGLRRFLEQTDVLILNKDEATELVMSYTKNPAHTQTVRDMMACIHNMGPQIVVITNARHGSYAYDGNEFFSMSGNHDKPKDTTGAGDCYGSSFIAGLIRYKGNIHKSMTLAHKTSSALVQHVGAQNGLLKLKDLPKSLR